jgi:hypothetical protein
MQVINEEDEKTERTMQSLQTDREEKKITETEKESESDSENKPATEESEEQSSFTGSGQSYEEISEGSDRPNTHNDGKVDYKSPRREEVQNIDHGATTLQTFKSDPEKVKVPIIKVSLISAKKDMRTSNSAAVLKTSKIEKDLKSPGVSSFIAGTEEVHVRHH